MKHGKSVPISLGRRLLIEHCHFSDATQKGVIKRTISIGPLVAALESAKAKEHKPFLPLIFVKAFAIVARDLPELRRSYVKLPWPQFYEHCFSIALMPITRIVEGEEVVMMAQFNDPASCPLPILADALRRMKTVPITEIRSFERALNIARLPQPLRRLVFWLGLNFGRQRQRFFGTFAVSAMGLVEPVYTIHPLTSLLTYGVINTDEALVDVTLSFDHRVYDGMTVVRTLDRIELALNGPIATELQAL